jgi:hypothetical protein
MSTRVTIAYSDDFHLYQECFEQDNVYLRLDGGEWAASLDTAVIDWRDRESIKPQLHIKMDVALWRKIVEGWSASQWAKDPNLDHKKLDFDSESTLKWLEEYKRNKEDGNTE